MHCYFSKPLCSLIILFSFNYVSYGQPQVIGLTEVLETEYGIIILKGKGDYYWNQRVTDLEQAQQSISKGVIDFTNFWTLSEDAFLKQHPYGLLTIHLRLRLPDSVNTYSLKVKSVVAAYELWSEGKLLAQNGKVGKTLDETQGDFQPRIIDLPRQEVVDLFWVMANFHHRKGGGIWEPILFGQKDDVLSKSYKGFAFDMFSASIMLFIVIYHLLMFAAYSRERSYLYFALLVFAALTRTMTTGEMVVEVIVEGFPYKLNQQLRYVGYYMSLGLIVVFIHSMFGVGKSIVVKVLFALACLFSLITFSLPNYLASHLVPYYHIVAIGVVVYCAIVIFKARHHHILEARISMVVLIYIFGLLTHTILISLNVIKGQFYHETTFLIIILSQMLILAIRHRRLYGEKQQLETNLKYKESDLETVISDNRLRSQFKDQVLKGLEKVLTFENGQLKSKLQSFTTDLKLELETEEKFNYLQDNIADINTAFDDKLKTNYPELTASEREICQLIKLNLSVKEIARIRKSSEGAIKAARHRIKKKMALDSLDHFESKVHSF